MNKQGGGRIVQTSSKAAAVGEPGHAAYGASKGAVLSLARAMAVDLAPHNITVDAVCPGSVVTDMLVAAVSDAAGRQALAQKAPLGWLGQPEEMAAAVLYLASDEAGWCTEQAISVDGGLSALLWRARHREVDDSRWRWGSCYDRCALFSCACDAEVVCQARSTAQDGT